MRTCQTVIPFVGLLVGACALTPTARHEPMDASTRNATAATTPERQSMLCIPTSSIDSPNRAVLTFDFAVIAREKGHDVSVFFAGDATMLMKEGVRSTIHAPGQPSATALIARARELGIPVFV